MYLRSTLFLLFFCTLLNYHSVAQQCDALACGGSYSTPLTATDQPLVSTTSVGCLGKARQLYWEFIYSPSGGDFIQSFTPSDAKDLDWAVYDIGTVAPSKARQTCPITTTGWTTVACGYYNSYGPTGPGIDTTAAPTTAGHYYAIAISVFGSGNYTFTVEEPTIGGNAVSPANCPSALPLNLLSFDGNVVNHSSAVSLTWVTENEINSSRFEVQKSDNGITNWQIAYTVSAKNTPLKNTYVLQDNNPFKGISYYRLKMIGTNGEVQYSTIITTTIKGSGLMVNKIVPNPVTDNLQIFSYSEKSCTINIQLVNAYGAIVYNEKRNCSANNNIITIDMKRFSSGIYILRIVNEADKQTVIEKIQKL